MLKRSRFATSVNMIRDCRTAVLDGKLQDFKHRRVQMMSALSREPARRGARIYARGEKRLIGINVSNSAYKRLIQKERFDRSFARFQASKEVSEIYLQSVRADSRQRRRSLRIELDPSKLPDVVINQRSAVEFKKSS